MAISVLEARVFKGQLFLREEPARRRIELQASVNGAKYIPSRLKKEIWATEELIDQALRSEKFMRQDGAEVQLVTCLSEEIKKTLKKRYRGWELSFTDSLAGTLIKISQR